MSSIHPLIKNCVTVSGNLDASHTLVFVHGFGTDQRAWGDVAAAFAADYRLVLLDNAGAGNSPPEAFQQYHYLNLHGYARDLLAVCDALKLRDAIVVGHSVGGMISLLTAIKQPEVFSRLILIGASPRYLNDGAYQGGMNDDDLKQIYRAMAMGYEAWADYFAPWAMGHPDRPSLAGHFASTIKMIPPKNALTVLCAIFQSDHRADLAQVQTPTLILQTKEDPAVPLAVAEYLHQHIQGSALEVINATGHLPHISTPDEVVRAIKTYLQG